MPTNRSFKVVETVPLTNILVVTIAEAFLNNWVFLYWPPKRLLSIHGSLFTSKFFQHVCNNLNVPSLVTTTYHSPCNGQVGQFNRTIIEAFCHYAADNSREWDVHRGTLTYTYDIQIHRATKCAPFELILSNPPQTLAVRPMAQDKKAITTAKYLHR